MSKQIVFPKFTQYQSEVNNWFGDSYKSGKIAVLKSVRQSGKTFFCIMQLIKMALEHKGCVSAIYEPTLNLARNVFRNLTKCLDGSNLIIVSNAQTLEVELINGSRIYFRSTEQTSRGLTVTGLLILDECAFLDDTSIYAILPLVNANNAPIIIASTPFTQEGYYWDMYKLGLDDNGRIKTFDWSKHPEISRFLSDEQKALYKKTMSKQMYTTEVLGDFLTDDGLLFTNLANCVKDATTTPKYAYVGIDFATGSDGDYTVLAIFNELGEMYKLYRTNNLSPMQQVDWLANILNELSYVCPIRKILAEQNSIGLVYIDALNQKINNKVKITNWVTSNQSKQDLVTNLQIALENEQITLLNDPILLDELKRYSAEYKGKTISYNAKAGHDDTVIATMLAYYAFTNSTGTYNLGNYKKIKKLSLAEKYG